MILSIYYRTQLCISSLLYLKGKKILEVEFHSGNYIDYFSL